MLSKRPVLRFTAALFFLLELSVTSVRTTVLELELTNLKVKNFNSACNFLVNSNFYSIKMFCSPGTTAIHFRVEEGQVAGYSKFLKRCLGRPKDLPNQRCKNHFYD